MYLNSHLATYHSNTCVQIIGMLDIGPSNIGHTLSSMDPRDCLCTLTSMPWEATHPLEFVHKLVPSLGT